MINSKSFQNLVDLKEEGIVILGAGGDLDEWVDGITENLFDEKIISENNRHWIKESFILNDNIKRENGRTDLVIIFSPNVEINIGKMAIWRLSAGYISWVSDFIVNYGSDYNSSSNNDDEEEGDTNENNL